MDSGTCRDCGADILWARLPNGSALPLDAEPNPLGGRRVDAAGCFGPGTGRPLPERYTAHYAMCPEGRK